MTKIDWCADKIHIYLEGSPEKVIEEIGRYVASLPEGATNLEIETVTEEDYGNTFAYTYLRFRRPLTQQEIDDRAEQAEKSDAVSKEQRRRAYLALKKEFELEQ